MGGRQPTPMAAGAGRRDGANGTQGDLKWQGGCPRGNPRRTHRKDTHPSLYSPMSSQCQKREPEGKVAQVIQSTVHSQLPGHKEKGKERQIHSISMRANEFLLLLQILNKW